MENSIVNSIVNEGAQLTIKGKTYNGSVMSVTSEGSKITHVLVKIKDIKDNKDNTQNRVFKIVSKNMNNGNQHKKRVYHSLKSFEKYGGKVIDRYRNWYDVDSYEFINGEWVLLKHYPCKKTKLITGVTIGEAEEKATKILNDVVIPQNKKYNERKNNQFD